MNAIASVEVEHAVRRFIVENFLYGNQDEDLKTDTSFLGEGLIDSTGVLELVGFLEKQFEIRVEDAEVIPDNLDSIGRICAYIDRKLAGQTAGAGRS